MIDLSLNITHFQRFWSFVITKMSQMWQHPYVNLFKHFNVSTWKKSTKEGEVSAVMVIILNNFDADEETADNVKVMPMFHCANSGETTVGQIKLVNMQQLQETQEKTVKCTVYRITGSIPAGNYIQLPKTGSQSLGLTGRYFYLLFKPIPTKYFVVHIDVATHDNLVVRISFSNLFKEFKSTSTWLQFPFVCNASKGSVHALAAFGSKDHSGPAPMSTHWTILCLDFQYILSMYLNRKYSYVKGVRLCANMLVKNIFTSDLLYEPGLSLEQVKKAGGLPDGVAALPREMSFPVLKGERWQDLYDIIRFPNDASQKPFDSIQHSNLGGKKSESASGNTPRKVDVKKIDVSKCVSDRVSMIHNLTKGKQPRGKTFHVTSELPSVGVGDPEIQADSREVHAFVDRDHDTNKFEEESQSIKHESISGIIPKKSTEHSLLPDPILRLKRIVGFGGCTFREALWTLDGTMVVYPCHAIVVAMKISNGHQRFFIGHTDKVSCISMDGSSNLLASGQTGQLSVVRIWKFLSGECLALCKTHVHSLQNLCFSHKGNLLCGVGKDGQGRNMVVIWNTSKVTKSREVTVMAKAHTDVDIVRMKVAAFDDTRMVSCGRDNIRLWRVKEGSLRSAPVNLGEHHMMEFTDVCFEAGYHSDKDPNDRLLYACSKSGHIFEIDIKKVSIHHVRRLLPTVSKSSKDKETFRSGSGIAINCLSVNEMFCVTGSDDGYLRLWPLDFAHVYLEAEHEGPVTAVDFTADGLKILAGTASGNLGILDVSTRSYTTVIRSHVDRIQCVAIDPYRKHIATVSNDRTIRVWDADTLQQLYDFSAPDDCPSTISYHPSRQIFSCGFESGIVRVFNVQTTTMLAEHKQHRGKVTGLSFSPTGDYLYSCCSLGSLAQFDAASERYPLLRLLGNTVARGEKYSPDALSVSPDGRRVAFVGPSEYTVTVVDAKTLEETLRIDITSLCTNQGPRTSLDSALKVAYAPLNVNHLLVVTSNNKLLKFEGRTGRLLAEIDHIHRNGCTALAVTENGHHMATGGDKVIKIWDYSMKLDANFQVFIGHSENLSRVMFTPDGQGLLSVGEALYLWDFLAVKPESPREGREYREKNYFAAHAEKPFELEKSPGRKSLGESFMDLPRRTPPRPASFGSLARIEDLSSIHKLSNEDEDHVSITSEREEILVGPELRDKPKVHSKREDAYDQVEIEEHNSSMQPHIRYKSPAHTPIKKSAPSGRTPKKKQGSETPKPGAFKHFVQREKSFGMAQRRYTAPPNQAGLKLRAVIGYNGNGRSNMIWQPDTGVFVYTSGNIIILEDLNTSEQKHLAGHVEEISTIAMQNDCQVLASASGSFGMVGSQICIWDLHQLVCKKVLSHHEHDVVCLTFSRDDRFLISVGDYRDPTIVVWSTHSYGLLTTSRAAHPIHELKWDPYTVNEFASVGQNGTVLFWLLDETTNNISLNVHEAELPDELFKTHHGGSRNPVEFTCLEYAGDSTLFIGTNNGNVSAWDTRHNSCFMHWEADSSEIDFLVCRGGQLLTGSKGRNLRIWSVVGVGEMRLPGDHNSMRNGGLTMEDEMNLDGSIVSLAFDDAMDMGIVGTSVGTLWYINWGERTSVRLVSGHKNRVNGLSVYENELLASCADDGGLRIWYINSREQVLQFQVKDQACTCLSFSPKSSGTTAATTESQKPDKQVPYTVAGYSDGTVRMFDVNKVEMALKMHPHAVAVTAISFSSDGHMIISGGSDGLIAVSSPTTGMTVRVITDHKGASITSIDISKKQDQDMGISAPLLWLAASADRRVSVWSADWSKDFCELVDWLSFPAPAFTPDGSIIPKEDQGSFSQLPPSLAKFSPEEPDIIIYTGYGMNKQIQFYSLSQRKVVRTVALTHWGTSLDVVSDCPLVAVGANERLLKVVDYYEGSFQDFLGHNDSVQVVKFSEGGKYLFTASYSEIFVWEVTI